MFCAHYTIFLSSDVLVILTYSSTWDDLIAQAPCKYNIGQETLEECCMIEGGEGPGDSEILYCEYCMIEGGEGLGDSEIL